MKLSSNIQILRKCAGNMTQEKLAERMGVSRQTVSKWETGLSSPSGQNLIYLSKIFSVPVEYFLASDSEKRKS